MLSREVKEKMEKQQYRIIGLHSAVKICGWTKNMLRGKGSCYKHKFYGIKSNQCMQMTTSFSCANRCLLCWRDYKAPVTKKWNEKIDEPEFILKGSLEEQKKLLSGFKGFEDVQMELYKESAEVKHVALSLTGEPIIYPKINEFIELLNEKKISTFLVTNGQYPEAIKKLKPVTQLYLSMDAPNKELMKKIDVPLFNDYWSRFNNSLKAIAKKKTRTCVRITLVKGINDIEPENYAELIKKADPDFVEVKSYMFVGESRKRLKEENMPLHSEVKKFTEKLNAFLSHYEIVSEHKPSRVLLLAKKKFKKKGKWLFFIDFEKWQKLVLKKKKFESKDYSKETPKENLI
ncbi:4-demethylwyosine synthase TYW1 [Candidatus Micrarchaeota archaeon]|nr:4-demethylwyosine synthase TYW1 [Candidatus Micrarchaeota archaeon]